MDVKATYTSAKAWVALLALIVTGITASNVVPVAGTAHTIWIVVVVIVGAVSTWAIPNTVKTIDGEAV